MRSRDIRHLPPGPAPSVPTIKGGMVFMTGPDRSHLGQLLLGEADITRIEDSVYYY